MQHTIFYSFIKKEKLLHCLVKYAKRRVLMYNYINFTYNGGQYQFTFTNTIYVTIINILL